MDSPGNLFAFTLLLFWMVFTAYLYKAKSMQNAVLWSILGGYLILPAKTFINLPLVPNLTKFTIPVIVFFICSFIFGRYKFKLFTKSKITNLFVLIVLITPFFTMLNNTEPMISESGNTIIAGMTFKQAISYSLFQFLWIGAFFIGRSCFYSLKQQMLLFKVIVVSAVLYTPLIFVELKLSPQLHTWVYGYFPHDFSQVLRDSGYRPIVFLGHGLLVSFFLATAVLCSLAVYKVKENYNFSLVDRFSKKTISFYLLFMLLISKSVAPFLYGIFYILSANFLSAKKIIFIALLLATISITYPIAKMFGVFPSEVIVSLAKTYAGDERSESLNTRFKNEDITLEKAKNKLFFGWGPSRDRIYDQWGRDAVVTDGSWIVQFGRSGAVSFFAQFGLIFLAILRARKALKVSDDANEKTVLALHCLLISVVLIDQLPNSSLSSFYWLLAGALMGRSDNILGGYSKVKNDTSYAEVIYSQK